MSSAAQAALQNAQFEQVSLILDAAELESTNPQVLGEAWPHSLHLLGLIYNDQLEDARFLWKRIPDAAKADNSELEAVWKLLQFCWARQYHAIWQALQAQRWSAGLRPMVDALVTRFRAQMLGLLSKAYSTIAPAKVASLVGLRDQAEATSWALAQGWTHDAASGMLHVKAQPQPKAPLNRYADLQSLSQYMVNLEG